MFKNFFRHCILKFGYQISPIKEQVFSEPSELGKAKNFKERFKDVISDPLNLLINRVPEAGYVDANMNVFLHNGLKVPIKGKYAYYDDFSDILIFNRGVHEPLEEFCFQEVLKIIDKKNPIMLELGSYWAHYSMWFLQIFKFGKSFMVEPNLQNLNSGKHNFNINSLSGEFIQSEVCKGEFEVDIFIQENHINSLDILHCDIQGLELEMLERTHSTLNQNKVDYIFISTHSESIHNDVCNFLIENNYVIEVSSNFEDHTTSYDGFVLASNPETRRVFQNFKPLGRLDILNASPQELIDSLKEIN
jgi:hypothetical protein